MSSIEKTETDQEEQLEDVMLPQWRLNIISNWLPHLTAIAALSFVVFLFAGEPLVRFEGDVISSNRPVCAISMRNIRQEVHSEVGICLSYAQFVNAIDKQEYTVGRH